MELRLAEDGRFLTAQFLPAFNRRYTVKPRAPSDIPRPLGLRDDQVLLSDLSRV